MLLSVPARAADSYRVQDITRTLTLLNGGTHMEVGGGRWKGAGADRLLKFCFEKRRVKPLCV